MAAPAWPVRIEPSLSRPPAWNRSLDDRTAGNQAGPALFARPAPFSCAHPIALPLPAAASRQMLAPVERLHAALAAHVRHGQAAPLPQPSMPDPRRDAPTTPLCRR